MIGISNNPSDLDIAQSAVFLLVYYCLIAFQKIIVLELYWLKSKL